MIVQYLGVALISVVTVVLQSSLPLFKGDLLYVDMLFATVVMVGLFKDPVNGSVMCFGIGFLQDTMSGGVTGYYMTVNLVVFFAAQALRERLSPDTPLSQLAIGVGLAILDLLLVILLHKFFTDPLLLSFKKFLFMMLGALINGALVPVIYYLYKLVPGFIEETRGPQIGF